MANYYRVIGGLKGAYMSNYNSPVTKSKKSARGMLKEQKERAKEEAVRTGNKVVRENKDSFEIDRGDTAINMKYEIVEVPEDEAKAEKESGRGLF